MKIRDAVEMLPAPVKSRLPVSMRGSLPASQVLDTVNQVYAMQMLKRTMQNPVSGAGGMNDKSSWFQFVPMWLNDPNTIENVCVQSWLAERFINMPVDDMFAQPRVYDNDTFRDEINRLRIDEVAADAMKLGRKFGTGFFWLITKEGKTDTPLDVNAIRRGDIVNCVAVDRNDVSVVTKTKSIMSENFGKPEIYSVYISEFGRVDIHHTRLYRFDGKTPDTINGWRQYEKDWGVSELASAMQEVFNDSSVTNAITQLIQEASIPVHKVDGLTEIMTRGKCAADEQNVDDIMKAVSLHKSIYNTIFMDGEDSFERESVNFSNIPDLMDRFEERFAMSSGISTTRFLGKSASGLNATGEGDQRNDSKSTRIRQRAMLEPFYRWADPIIARSAGTQVPDFTFPPLFEMSEKEMSDVDLNRAKSAKLMVDNGSWSPKEAKEYLATGKLPVGSLSPDAERMMGNNAVEDPTGKINKEAGKKGKAGED
jgi:phage-related protein (TIGR01555 family)